MLWALLIDLGAVVLAMLLLWLVAVRIQDVSFIDAIWAYGMVGAVALSAVQAPQLALPGLLLLGLVALWGLRLGTHLILRWRRLGRDPRYVKIMAHAMEKNRWGFATAALVMVFGMQGPLLWGVSLPAQAGVLAGATALPAWGWAGAALALLGIGFETIGDIQLEAFRNNPAMKGKVLDTGLWRYTRHPNYFGDFVAWWGIFVVGLAAGAPWWTVVGPLFLSFTLTRWSGAPLLEKSLKKQRPDYAAYIARTSGFLPMPPKRG
jgi:steroid 5-alpha reductase family enzyme